MGLTPQDAAAALRDLPSYEEQLTERTAAMTNLVWGLATAVVFLTYGTAAHWLTTNNAEWGLAIAWMPGIAMGMLFTSFLWHHHGVATNKGLQRKDHLRSAFYMAVFLAIAAAIYFGLRAADVQWHVATIMILVNAVFAAAIATSERRTACGRYTYVAAAAMLIIAIATGLAETTHTAASLIGAFGVGGAYTLTGLYAFVKG